jgi:hypothetical protein
MTISKAVAVLVLMAAALRWGSASAQESDSVREAAKHFQRGVALYNEADYRGALVEFKRAGSLAPTAAAFYNIGETQYQLQDYAGALGSFERYLAEAGPGDSHRAEVENNIQALRSRIGFVAVTTAPAGAEITIDDQPVGKTPLDKPIRVTIGQRKVIATLPGRPAVVRYIDVAAEDNVSVNLQLGSTGPAEPAATAQPAVTGSDTSRPSRAGSGSAMRIFGWVATGALAAGAATFGVLAIKQTSDLKTERESFPTTASTLNHTANLATTYSIVADALGAGALIVGGITLYSTLSASSSAPSGTAAQLRLGFRSVHFEANF